MKIEDNKKIKSLKDNNKSKLKIIETLTNGQTTWAYVNNDESLIQSSLKHKDQTKPRYNWLSSHMDYY